jgi:hypothetical protein
MQLRGEGLHEPQKYRSRQSIRVTTRSPAPWTCASKVSTPSTRSRLETALDSTDLSNDSSTRTAHELYIAARDELGASYRAGDDVDWLRWYREHIYRWPTGTCDKRLPHPSTLPPTSLRWRPCPRTGGESRWADAVSPSHGGPHRPRRAALGADCRFPARDAGGATGKLNVS